MSPQKNADTTEKSSAENSSDGTVSVVVENSSGKTTKKLYPGDSYAVKQESEILAEISVSEDEILITTPTGTQKLQIKGEGYLQKTISVAGTRIEITWTK